MNVLKDIMIIKELVKNVLVINVTLVILVFNAQVVYLIVMEFRK